MEGGGGGGGFFGRPDSEFTVAALPMLSMERTEIVRSFFLMPRIIGSLLLPMP